jgi:hypothetical protein
MEGMKQRKGTRRKWKKKGREDNRQGLGRKITEVEKEKREEQK